jgi:hypothetical protein
MDVFVNERLRYAINMVATSERHVLPKATPFQGLRDHHPRRAEEGDTVALDYPEGTRESWPLRKAGAKTGWLPSGSPPSPARRTCGGPRDGHAGDLRQGGGRSSCAARISAWRAQAKQAACIPSTTGAQLKAGLEQKRQTPAAIAGLGGRCTMVDSYYMVDSY